MTELAERILKTKEGLNVEVVRYLSETYQHIKGKKVQYLYEDEGTFKSELAFSMFIKDCIDESLDELPEE